MSRIAAVFPGQGSQSVGMLAALSEQWPEVGQTFQEASEALGYDLEAIVRDNPEDRLNQTEYTQPAMLAADVAVARVWSAAGGPEPARAAGHSLGEYAALVQAGALGFADAIRLVAERARLMQNAVPAGEGGMAALLGLDGDRVAEICEHLQTERIVEPVNFNAPGQVVIAGHADAVAQAIEAAREAGAKRAVELPVSVPSHSSLMKDAAASLGEYMADIEFAAPGMPVVHNVDAAEHADVDGIREALRRQLYNPVRWTESVQALRDAGAEVFVELGPGKVLTGLARRIDRSMTAFAVEDPASLEKALDYCRENGA
ncbi:ACP S-malonyltransferase [Halofilum ochraceum]|uniref:ACP S-malonyltransferase n=1 Tax=Halofilum ochraceum TaxID=1611323 RepID=UPI0008DA718B|nr:ACP S-malonyltransferase [Halofilum ochraceum]